MSDCIDVNFFAEDRHALYDSWDEHLLAQKEWADALADPAPFHQQYPTLFARFWRHIVSTRDRKKSTIRRGTSRAWYPSKKPQHVRYHVSRHLSGEHEYWLGMPHGPETRCVTLDADNHDDSITKTLAGLSVPYLQRLRRLHAGLGKRPWIWCVSSRSWGVHLLLPLGRPMPSIEVQEHYKAVVERIGVPCEVYPWGHHNHRLPFGRDFITLGENGPITGAVAQIEHYLAPKVATSWEAIYTGLVESWLREAVQHPEARHRVHARLDVLNRWEYDGFPLEEPIVSDATSSVVAGCPHAASSGWQAYKEQFGDGRGSWVKLVVDLATHGVPYPDDLFSPVVELAKWLLHVELFDHADRISRTHELLMSWLSSKSNGNVSRISEGKLPELSKQVERIVHFADSSEDFLGAFENMRSKRNSGKYVNVIEVANLISGERPRGTQEQLEKRQHGITYNPLSNLALEDLDNRLKSLRTNRKDARARQLTFARNVLDHLETSGGEAELSQEICKRYGLPHNRDQDKVIRAMIEDNLIEPSNMAKQGTRQTRRYSLTS